MTARKLDHLRSSLGPRTFKGRLSLAEETWKAVLAAVYASTSSPLVFDPSSRMGRHHMAFWRNLAVSVALGTVARGEGEVGRWKASASTLRFAIFKGDPLPGRENPLRQIADHLGLREPKPLLQLTFLGRALPYGSAAVQDASLEAHGDVLGTAVTVPPYLLEAARMWATNWSRTNRPDCTPAHPLDIKEASCLEYSRKDGGIVRSLRSSLARLDLPSPLATPAELADGDRRVQSRLRASWFAGFRTRAGVGTSNVARRAVVCAVAERGFKSRVVTAHSSARVAFLHQFRRSLFSSLKRDPRVRTVVEGHHRKAVDQTFRRGRPDGCVVSADLTAASDRIPDDLLRAIITGLFEGGMKLPPGVTREDFIAAAVGPYELHYRSGRVVTTQQGVLMGLPTTWPLLCLVHLFWVDLSQAAPEGKQRYMGGKSWGEREVICGDDLAAWWRPARVGLYEGIARECGAKFSAGKHVRSRQWGIFTEEVFRVRNPDTSDLAIREWSSREIRRAVSDWTLADLRSSLPAGPTHHVGRAAVRPRLLDLEPSFPSVIPLRWAVRPPRSLPGQGSQSLPPWFTVGPAASSVALHSGAWGTVCRVRSRLYPSLGKDLVRMAPPRLPRALGGGGLPTPRGPAERIGNVASSRWRRALGGGLYRSLPTSTPASGWVASSSPAYFASAKQAAGLATHPEVRLVRPWRGRPEPGFVPTSLLDQELGVRAARGVVPLVLGQDGPPLSVATRPSPFGVRKAVDREVSRLLRRGGFLRPQAPVGRLVSKQVERRVWWRKEAVFPPAPPPSLVSSGLAALMARFRQPGS